jgi:putative endonuclease
MHKNGFVYIISNGKDSVLYIGVTSDLVKRMYEHRESLIEGFSKTYQAYKLLYYEYFDAISDAILREKQLKNWKRDWKLDLIRASNPEFRDLYEDII